MMATTATLHPPSIERPLPTLTSNFLWTLGGTVIYSASQWGMLSLLAKRGSPSSVGVFALGLAISAPVFMFSNLQLRGVQATDATSRYTFSDFFTLRSVGSLVALLFVVALCMVMGYRGELLIVVLALSVAKAFESWSDVIAGLLQKNERLDLAARAVALRGVVSLVIFALVFEMTKKVTIASIALAMTWAVVVSFYDGSLARRVLKARSEFFGASNIRMRELFVRSLPLGIVMTLNSLNVNLPRYLVIHFLGTSELGIFASLAYLLTALNVLSVAMGQAATARMASMFSSGDLLAFRDVLLKLIGFGIVVGTGAYAGSLIYGKALMQSLYGSPYSSHQRLLLILSVTAGISTIATFLGFAATAAQSFRLQVPVIVGMTIVTLLASYLLIPRFGLDGAGIALLAASLLQLAGLALVTVHAMRVRRKFL